MDSTASEILKHLAQTLRNTGAFAQVTLGGNESTTMVPRVRVICEAQDEFAADDTPGSRWVRLRVRVAVRTRSSDAAEAATRVLDLCNDAAESLLVDPYRGQRCRDLPIGPATEISRCTISIDVRRPEAEASFAVNCHFEIEEGE